MVTKAARKQPDVRPQRLDEVHLNSRCDVTIILLLIFQAVAAPAAGEAGLELSQSNAPS